MLSNKLARIHTTNLSKMQELEKRIRARLTNLISRCDISKLSDVLEFNVQLTHALHARSVARLEHIELKMAQFQC